MHSTDSTTRREFLARTAATAAGLAAAGSAAWPQPATLVAAEAKRPADELPIIDVHQHLWDLSKFKLPWTKDAPKLSHSFLISDYHKAAEGLNVVKTVYMEVD